MMQSNVTEVRKLKEILMMLKKDVKENKSKAIEMITEVRRELGKILEKEEKRYIENNCPEAEVVVINDEKLNALSEAIGFLEEKMTYPNKIKELIDNAVNRLKVCTMD